MKTVKEAQPAGKRALIRVDFNVPLDANGNITDDKRMREALPTIQHLLENGGSVVLMSHLGRPKEGPEAKYSLSHLTQHLSQLLERPVLFADDCMGEAAFATTAALQPGQVVLLENLRFYKQEEKGDVEFAGKLAKHGDYYVNDAFGTAHRAHASTTIVAQFFTEKYAGFLMEGELKSADRVLKEPARPFTAIMGGAKVSDKIMVIENLLSKVDNLLIGGGMAYTFLRAKGMPIGKSLVEDDKVVLAAALLKKARQMGVTILTPIDSVAADKFAVDAETGIYRNEDFPADRMGLDIGPETFQAFYDIILASKTILWNGPMGVFEMEPFAQGTMAVAQALAEATEKGAFTLIGGGDSAAAIAKAGLEDKVSYVSTGGGAMLELLEGQVLPGVAALEA
jgi:phosphoglycerate kinase